jgi:hypothetical protein
MCVQNLVAAEEMVGKGQFNAARCSGRLPTPSGHLAEGDARLPWTQHGGKGYEQMDGPTLLRRFRDTRDETIALVQGLERGLAAEGDDAGHRELGVGPGHLARRPRCRAPGPDAPVLTRAGL